MILTTHEILGDPGIVVARVRWFCYNVNICNAVACFGEQGLVRCYIMKLRRYNDSWDGILIMSVVAGYLGSRPQRIVWSVG